MHYYLITNLSWHKAVFWQDYLGDNQQKAINHLENSVKESVFIDGRHPTYEYALKVSQTKLEEYYPDGYGMPKQYKGL